MANAGLDTLAIVQRHWRIHEESKLFTLPLFKNSLSYHKLSVLAAINSSVKAYKLVVLLRGEQSG